MASVRLARMAMACRFELILEGEDAVWLRAAGEKALAEIARLEAQLTIFDASSEVSRINARAAAGPVRVEARLFRLLQQCCRLSQQSRGAFDLTVAPLMRAWGFFRDTGRLPDPDILAEARARTGMDLVELDGDAHTVHFKRDGVTLDFGAVGKGYAVDEAVSLLREAGVERAFLHGGTSTMYALGQPLNEDAWKVVIPRPGTDDAPLSVVRLRDESLSVSAVWGKSFEADGKVYGHVLDPRLGKPVDGAVLAAVVGESATESDALSTALLVEGVEILPGGYRALTVYPSETTGEFRVVEVGLSALIHHQEYRS